MPTDYEQTFDEFWRDLVCHPDGTLNRDAVMRELHDYATALDEVPKVYMHVTGGRLSKPNTKAAHVIDAADEHYAGLHEAAGDGDDPEVTDAEVARG